MSIRGTVRITGVAKNTVTKLLINLGCACADFHHRSVRNLTVQRLQCDEIWSFVGAKKKNATLEQEQEGWGDVWTWTAIDADTKLCVTYFVGDRGKHSAFAFMQDAASRIVGRLQITTDAHKPYLAAVEQAFGGDANYAQLHKIYGATEANEAGTAPQHASAAR
jgi:IS1 family transposase